MRSIIYSNPKKKINMSLIVNLFLLISIIFFLISILNTTELIPIQMIKSNNPIENVPVLNQNPVLPTGCEAVCAAMLLQWAGIDVTMEEIADALPKGELPYQRGNQLMGGNPDYEFVGDPYQESGFGVFHKPIADIVDKYIPAQDMTGCAFQDLLKVIDSDRPVIVWATIDMKEPSINSTWFDEKGNKVVWKSPQHALVLIGYTDKTIIVNDPLVGGYIEYSRIDFKSFWEYMGSQAVTIENH